MLGGLTSGHDLTEEDCVRRERGEDESNSGMWIIPQGGRARKTEAMTEGSNDDV